MATAFDRIDFAEDRGAFSDLLIRLDIPFPEYGTATDVQGALSIADRIGYPVLIRPSYVLGGQGMRIAVKQEELERYVANILKTHPENAFLIDKYLEHAIEVDVDSVYDGGQLHITGMMQHIEPAGVHSGTQRPFFLPTPCPMRSRSPSKNIRNVLRKPISKVF